MIGQIDQNYFVTQDGRPLQRVFSRQRDGGCVVWARGWTVLRGRLDRAAQAGGVSGHDSTGRAGQAQKRRGPGKLTEVATDKAGATVIARPALRHAAARASSGGAK